RKSRRCRAAVAWAAWAAWISDPAPLPPALPPLPLAGEGRGEGKAPLRHEKPRREAGFFFAAFPESGTRVRKPMRVGQRDGGNNRIETIKRMACGSRDSDCSRFKTRAVSTEIREG